MWKLRRLSDGDSVILRLSGRVEEGQFIELQEAFASEGCGQAVILDLEEVKVVGQDFITFLARCETAGTRLRNCPAYIREWIGREKAARR